ncbi:polysaccharide lyase 6 family protein [Paenibacillus xerothermodurans]|uniref:Right-handed parallel beta-helix repeat-containing protein n=1 Tax=Paenibacillus xerothermodurans TaxID=1977292 RepID=A0A2W1NCL4_PAEXE|nr:polysaccharide lyase 6 family protein [Paenibacillus xerothermodurans]PZE21704.1 hypothetical protein CBW46_004610 [Paenibacillus xerothermodurans]
MQKNESRKGQRKMAALTIATSLVTVPLSAGSGHAAAQRPHELETSVFSESARAETRAYGSKPRGRATQVERVANMTELAAAMGRIQPGGVIEMADGVWKDAEIVFRAEATADRPVTLCAKTPGKVILEGNSKLSVQSPHLIVDGLHFKQSTPTNTGVVISLNSDYGRLTNTAIDNYNPPNTNTRYQWVYINGDYNTVDNNYFAGKNHSGPLLAQHRDSKHNTVARNHFKDIPFHNENGREIVQVVGYGDNEELGSDGAFMTIEYNLFEHADGEGAEIISLKSNHNLVRYNTFRGSRGGIVGRSGNNNTIQGNFILGEKIEGTSGIRVSGQNHTVIQNYVADTTGIGLTLTSGEYYVDADGKPGYLTPSYEPIFRPNTPYGLVPTYGQVKNGLFAFNTFVNNGSEDIHIGYWYKNHWPRKQLVLLPENNKIQYNLSYKAPGSVPSVTNSVYAPPQDRMPPLDVFEFQPNHYKGNAVIGGQVALHTNQGTQGFQILNSKMRKLDNGIHELAPGQMDINAGRRHFQTDHDQKLRSRGVWLDPGGDGSAIRALLNRPLTGADVGPNWMP